MSYVQRHISRTVSEIGQKTYPRLPSPLLVQIDNRTRPSVPTYNLKDVNRIAEETNANHDLCGSYDIKRALTQIKAPVFSTNGDKSQNQKLQRIRPNQQPHAANIVDLPNTTATRNKSMDCQLIRTNVAKTSSGLRPAVRLSQTSSATATKCPTLPSRTAGPHNQLQRKVHGDRTTDKDSSLKRPQTYSVKKPLPHKAGSVTAKRSSAKNFTESSCISPSSESLLTQLSDPQWQADDSDDDNCAAQKLQTVVVDKCVPSTRGKTKLPAVHRTPTPKPSLKQLNNVQKGHVLNRLQSPAYVSNDGMLQHLSKGRTVKKDHTRTDGLHSYSSPSDHSFGSRYDIKCHTADQAMFNDADFATADCPTRHVQIAADNNDGRYRKSVEQQATEPISCASQESVISCRPHKTRMSRHLPPTVSVSTLATETSRLLPRATRPVAVAPCGPAGHRRVSKIPRPKFSVRPSASATSSLSKCSSVTSLRSEFNYARPMPIERIPFSKFGLEYIVPLAKQEVTVSAVEAFSITGLPGQRKRFLPLTESVPEDLWEECSEVDALPVATPHHDAGKNVCTVSITSSLVARPTSHVATQTHKSVSVTPPAHRRKKTSVPRKEKAEKQDEATEDYSGLLVRLVQLLYLQTKLNASKSDKNNSSSAERSNVNVNQTIMDYLQKRQVRLTTPTRSTHVDTGQQSSDHGARVYRAGSSVTQVYSKNHPAVPVDHAEVEPASNWANAIKSRTVYFDEAQPERKPWSSYRSQVPTTFKPPTYSLRQRNYDVTQPKISAFPGSSKMNYSYRPTA